MKSAKGYSCHMLAHSAGAGAHNPPPSQVWKTCAKRQFLMANWRVRQGLDLVVRALGVLLTQQVGANREVATCRLALAGGFDARLEENREVLAQLRELVFTLGLSEQARRRKRPLLLLIPCHNEVIDVPFLVCALCA